MLKIMLATVAALSLLASAADADVLKLPGSQTEVKIGGTGAGTVVLESGLGIPMEGWDPLLPVIGTFARYFSYNRLGTGRSGPAMSNPTPRRIAEHLHALLVEAKLPKPWTLVGHSIGGADVMTFARMYPNEVAAVVLIDPTPHAQPAMQRKLMPGVYRKLNVMLSSQGGSVKAEFRAFEKAEEEFRLLGPFPRVPIYLLRATRADPGEDPEPREYRDWRRSAQRELASQSPCPVERDIANAGHFIQRDQPKEVLAAIYEASKRDGC